MALLVLACACNRDDADVVPALAPPDHDASALGDSSVATDGGVQFDADATMSGSGSGAYFASCLLEIANGEPAKALSFWVDVKATPSPTTVTVTNYAFTLNALKLKDGAPPISASRNDIVSTTLLEGSDVYGGTLLVEAQGEDIISFSGNANPISGDNLAIRRGRMKGRFRSSGFCARLAGDVIAPTAAARTLDESKNICLFTPTREGASIAKRPAKDYNVADCPL